ncbi:acyl-CoA dehydrogenase [Glacieibacterium frigidum]|uniref:3-methylmercaptopropionyl-CoA dehydrogenase n=1 Tax=Glacieibacterium frigidum TaxID=2593303 RepID=A0A552UJ70_9SPHN|nr:acyl-CoA dehydrogenase [Glacieibacterium frigidum]TRW18278.1 acyl-CoA dehydrogenase [Glacieibacterium frigidum]
MYTAPIAEQRFVLDTIADIAGLSALPGFEAATPDMVDAILEEAGKLSGQVFAPLNRIGDTQGAVREGDEVRLPAGFADAYKLYVEGGWASLGAHPAHGGQGLPFVLASAVQEQLTSANMAFSLCMMLSQGAIEALQAHASPALQETYLTKLVSGEWTGTMNLTEPQAGSDVGALRTRAEPHADGSYRIAGTKIYITWGEHDVAPNIVHLVLARLPDAPPGTKGISLFLCPKFLPDGSRNDLRCVGIEHKLGIHASPTCTMAFGEQGNCVGYLVGAEGAGMRAMFTMMNHARVNVGLQGVAIAERATQGAMHFARERVQGGGKRIVEYADVRRMLMTLKSSTEAARALTYLNAAAVDRAHAGGDVEAQGLADLLTPITKGWATDLGVELSSLAIQVFGGMGYVEETGAAQHLRDARIATIYEGTNGIQAMDLVGRKLGQGAWQPLFADIRDFVRSLPQGELAVMGPYLDDALGALESATAWLRGAAPDDAGAGAAPYLRMFGVTLGGWLLARQAVAAQARLAAGEGDPAFLKAKIATARFFAEQILPSATALLGPVTRGASALYAIPEDALAA